MKIIFKIVSIIFFSHSISVGGIDENSTYKYTACMPYSHTIETPPLCLNKEILDQYLFVNPKNYKKNDLFDLHSTFPFLFKFKHPSNAQDENFLKFWNGITKVQKGLLVATTCELLGLNLFFKESLKLDIKIFSISFPIIAGQFLLLIGSLFYNQIIHFNASKTQEKSGYMSRLLGFTKEVFLNVFSAGAYDIYTGAQQIEASKK